uniref:Tyrosine specific protein phosphatases domain-containing protein n=1 Tax=Amphimedon queenslandica TaxID=400682 RepID=A0A1X7SDK0_AMPQE
DLQFDDGGSPPEDIIRQWLIIVKDTFEKSPNCSVAVHCVSGLG